jgi:hypothetical protein
VPPCSCVVSGLVPMLDTAVTVVTGIELLLSSSRIVVVMLAAGVGCSVEKVGVLIDAVFAMVVAVKDVLLGVSSTVLVGLVAVEVVGVEAMVGVVQSDVIFVVARES